ncbi:MAG: phage Gp37/Gp68 family protein [Phycisphaerae bacterium]|nr:phage Gp37/Gp68 family protein [Phycisphaerae bacterium]
MSDQTRIEWCDATWNPFVGCSKVSEGCENCYAERMANRQAAMGRFGYMNVVRDGRWDGHCARRPERIWDQPLRWRRPRRIFVCSMGDLFHESVPEEWIDRALRVASFAKRHTFMLLTKRPLLAQQYLSSLYGGIRRRWNGDPSPRSPLPNVWLGVTVENQERADERIPILLQTLAAVRFVSIEPMLGPVDVADHLPHPDGPNAVCYGRECAGCGEDDEPCDDYKSAAAEPHLDWVICGGETGPGARPMDLKWARSVRDQCKATGVPFFFKRVGPRVRVPADLMLREFPQRAT